jgi:hypothetical protein
MGVLSKPPTKSWRRGQWPTVYHQPYATLARATTKIGLANLVTNMHRLVRLQRHPALG